MNMHGLARFAYGLNMVIIKFFFNNFPNWMDNIKHKLYVVCGQQFHIGNDLVLSTYYAQILVILLPPPPPLAPTHTTPHTPTPTNM